MVTHIIHMVCADSMTYCKASTSLTITDATETQLQTSLTSVLNVTLWLSFQTVLTQVLAQTSITSATTARLLPNFQTILIQALAPTSLASAQVAAL